MKSFEPVFKKLTELFIENLPEYVQKINEQYNDGIILKPFENKDLITPCNKLPSFKFSTEKAEYTDKDRIIETTVFVVSFTVLLPPLHEESLQHFWRYVEAISKMIKEIECDKWLTIELTDVVKNIIYLKIKV